MAGPSRDHAEVPAKDSLHRNLGRVLRERRLSVDLSQEQLAHRSGLSPEYISELERGLKSPSVRTLAALAKTLATETHVLLRDAERPRRT